MAWRQLCRKRTALAGLGLIILLIMTAVLADVLAPYDPTATGVGVPMSPPSAQFPLGTDMLGRDMLSRIIYGSRVALYVGVFALVPAIDVGVPLGVIAGFYGGAVDKGKETHMKTRRLIWFSLLVVVVLWTNLGWAQQPRYGGTLRIAWPGDPAFFDANQGPAPGAPAGWLSHNMYNSLLKLTPPPELKIVPELAKSWEVLDGEKRTSSTSRRG
jgi:ABC-type dipeptide/oligopeptide/nickel transport system permease subunit